MTFHFSKLAAILEDAAAKRGGDAIGVARGLPATLIPLHAGGAGKPGGGTRRRGAPHRPKTPKAPNTPKTPARGGRASPPSRILLVDDDLDLLESLTDLLESEGYVVASAATPQAARKLVGEFRPDAAILDIKLGVHDGLDLVPVLRRDVPDLVCVAMTGFADTENAVHAVRVGADDYLRKPVAPDDLFKTLSRCLLQQRLVREREAAVAALRESENRYQTLTDVSPVGIYQTDTDGNCLFVNAQWRAITGLTEDRAAGDGWTRAIHVVDRERVVREVAQATRAGRPYNAEYRVQTPDGVVTWVTGRSEAYRDENGAVLGRVGTITDITRLKTIEGEIRQLNEDLEQRVAARTGELTRQLAERERTERNLVRAKEEADAANRAKSEFLSRMSHELRTPLNAVLGFAQVLEADPNAPLDETQAQAVAQIINGGEHLLALINEVLDLAQVERGRISLTLEKVEPRALIDDCLPVIALPAQRRGIRVVDRTTDRTVPAVKADYIRLKQILLNLLSNAVKFNHEGGTVALDCQTVTTGWLRISVSDTGPGIAADEMDQLFVPFSRLSAKVEGTGIGLTISRQLVELMGGRIGVDSDPGEGSAFWIELPLFESDPAT